MRLPTRDAAADRGARGSGRVYFPRPAAGPLLQVARRLLLAVLVLVVTVVIVYAGRGGYHDNAGGSLTFVDALYYSTVSLSTTGYGDIVPYSTTARLTNAFLLTPLRVIFLIILVGTTLEVLTERTREQYRLKRWRSTLRDHVLIVGYGTKGRSAAQTLIGRGIPRNRIVVVDTSPKVVQSAADEGFVGVTGDATRNDVLLRAEVERAKEIVIAAQRTTPRSWSPSPPASSTSAPTSSPRSARRRTPRCCGSRAPTRSSPVPARPGGCSGCR